MKQDGRPAERGQCAYCKKTIAAGAVASSGGLLFDSIRCKERFLRRATLQALSNVTRVARSRLKARTIKNAEAVYRKLGGRDRSTVRMILGAIL